jgi:hypothetical protein
MSRTHSFMRRRNTMRTGTAGPAMEALEPRSLLDSALPLLILSVANGSPAEHNTQPGTFLITRFGNTDQPLRVSFQIGGSATPGVDYTGLSGMATIPAGRRSVTLPIIPIDDLDVEGPETVRVTLSTDNTHYRLDQSTALNRSRAMTIKDDDVFPVVTLALPDPTVSETGNDTATITVRRTGAAALPLTVDLRIAGSATPGVDYDALPTSITILPGRRAAFLTVRAMNDALFEGNESVRVILQVPDDNRYTLQADQPATTRRAVFIQDRPLVTLLVTDPLATSFPGDTAEFVVFRSGPVDQRLQVSYRLEGSAIMGTDFAQLPTVITIPAGSSFTRIVIHGIDAVLTQQVKSLRLTLTQLATYNLDTSSQGRSSGVVSIIDDSVPPGV